MNYQKRIQKIQAEIKGIKNMLGETNDELSKLHGEIDALQRISEKDAEIKVGDEIVDSLDGSIKGVVTKTRNIKDDFVYIMWRDGSAGMVKKEDIIKTGKHYDIESVLNQLRE